MTGQTLIPRPERRVLVRQLTPVVLTAVGLIALYFVLPLDSDLWWAWTALGVAALLAAMPLTFRRAARVVNSPQPLIDGLAALSLVLNFLVLGFAATYFAIATHSTEFHGIDTKVDALYFTVVTLGTVGYGDIVATGQAARVLVTLQIMFDLLFIGTAIKVLAIATRRGIEARHGPTAVAELIDEPERASGDDR